MRMAGNVVILALGVIGFWVWVQRAPSAALPEENEEEE